MHAAAILCRSYAVLFGGPRELEDTGFCGFSNKMQKSSLIRKDVTMGPRI